MSNKPKSFDEASDDLLEAVARLGRAVFAVVERGLSKILMWAARELDRVRAWVHEDRNG